MRAITMHIDTLNLFRVNVTRDMVATINNKARLTELSSFMNKHSGRNARADNQIIIMGLLHAIPFNGLQISIPKCYQIAKCQAAPQTIYHRHNRDQLEKTSHPAKLGSKAGKRQQRNRFTINQRIRKAKDTPYLPDE